jgi:predicted RNA binding protein YcfA (HicA-like mRNA interferase family)
LNPLVAPAFYSGPGTRTQVKSPSTDSHLPIIAGPQCPVFFIMGSQAAEIRKHLKKYGWVLLRNGSKHLVYEREGKKILIPQGTKVYTRSYKTILMQIEGRRGSVNPAQLNLNSESESLNTQDSPTF